MYRRRGRLCPDRTAATGSGDEGSSAENNRRQVETCREPGDVPFCTTGHATDYTADTLSSSPSGVRGHTHSTPKNTHKRIYTHKPSTLFTRTFTQQRGSGVFSFDPIHAILVFHAVSPNRKHNTHAHTGPNIHIFTRQSALFFFTPTSTISPF